MTSRSRPASRVPLVCGSLAGLAALFVGSVPSSRIGAQVPTPASYTEAQADQGQAVYVEHCASCHGPNMDDGEFAPPLKSVDFRVKWGLRPTEALFTFTSTKMPPDRPGALGDKSYAEVLAYVFQENVREDLGVALVAERAGAIRGHFRAREGEERFGRPQSPFHTEVDAFERGRELTVVHIGPVTRGTVLDVDRLSLIGLSGGVAGGGRHLRAD